MNFGFRTFCPSLIIPHYNTIGLFDYFNPGCLKPSPFGAPPLYHKINSRNKNQCEERGDGEASNNGNGQGGIGLSTLSQSQGHWNQPTYCREGSHQNRS